MIIGKAKIQSVQDLEDFSKKIQLGYFDNSHSTKDVMTEFIKLVTKVITDIGERL